MTTTILSQRGNKVVIQTEIELTGSMLEMEASILKSCNEVGMLGTEEALKKFDTDGSAIRVGDVKWTVQKQSNHAYQTPYGVIQVKRNLYQTAKGGKTYCPLEYGARIIRNSTPRFAKMVSNKYARMNAPEACADLEENHGRKVTMSFLQNVADVVGSIAQAKEEKWIYHMPKLEEAVAIVAISMDGAHLLTKDDGWREAMVGAISLYNKKGERLHTIYIGAAPEYGKTQFINRIEREIKHVKKLYPKALYIGIADGAKNNWSFLEQHTEKQLLDFYHVTEYLANVAEAAFPEKTVKHQREAWLQERCHSLKHEPNAAQKILNEMHMLQRRKKPTKKPTRIMMENLAKAVTYFTNNVHRMNYAEHVAKNLPIGSGVTEAACKTLIKQRFCRSGMSWKEHGIKVVLSLRALIQTKERWEQFWGKINQYGTSIFD